MSYTSMSLLARDTKFETLVQYLVGTWNSDTDQYGWEEIEFMSKCPNETSEDFEYEI
jgi:hypothetical protein